MITALLATMVSLVSPFATNNALLNGPVAPNSMPRLPCSKPELNRAPGTVNVIDRGRLDFHVKYRI